MKRYDETVTMASVSLKRYTLSQMNNNRLGSFIVGAVVGIFFGIVFCSVVLGMQM